jgi:predicted metalloenzyme YecM
MDQHQRELRRAADQAFLESLNHLGISLQVSEGSFDGESEPLPTLAVSAKQLETLQKTVPPIDLEELEDAAADIENYMKTLGGEEAVEAEEVEE